MEALLERQTQYWDAERQAWQQRERALLDELTDMRQEVRQLLQQQQQQMAAGLPSHPVAPPSPGVNAWAGLPTPSGIAAPPAPPPPAAAPPLPAGVPPLQVPPGAAAVAAALRAVAASGSAGVSGDSGGGSTSAGSAPWEAVFQDLGGPLLGTAASTGSGSSSNGGNSSSNGSVRGGAARPVARAGAAAAAAASAAPSAASNNGGSGDSDDQVVDLPPAARSIAAAIRAVEQGDILLGGLGFPAATSAPATPPPTPPAPVTPTPAPAAALAPAAAAAAVPVPAAAEVEPALGADEDESRRDGLPPVLSAGDDDIFWVSKLHGSLVGSGFYPHDEEIEDWVFGQGTLEALLAFQACHGLPETGVCDAATWKLLLGQGAAVGDGPEVASPPAPAVAVAGAVASAPAAAAAAGVAAAPSTAAPEPVALAAAAAASTAKWPVLMDQDGGREVHALHAALTRHGYHCGDDEMRWWMLGDTTLNALKTFQSCTNLPETGVCDEVTWRALLGDDATPDMLLELRVEEYEDDMSAPAPGSVWLLGEQRWSRAA